MSHFEARMRVDRGIEEEEEEGLRVMGKERVIMMMKRMRILMIVVLIACQIRREWQMTIPLEILRMMILEMLRMLRRICLTLCLSKKFSNKYKHQ